MFCTKCGAKLPDGSKFCTNCGTPIGTEEGGTTVMPAAGETRVMGGQPTQVSPQAGQVPVQPTQVAQTPVSPQPAYGVAPQQPAYQSVPQQPAYGQEQQAGKGSRRGVVIGVVIAIVAVAVAAVAFIMVDPMGLFGGKAGAATSQTAPSTAATTSAASTSAASTSAASTSAASTSAASTSAAQATSSDYVIPDSGTHSYTSDDIRRMNLSVDQLWYARNEIYARHGRKFKDQTLQAYFNSKSWYTPIYSPEEFDDSVQLSGTEKANAEAIKTIEQSMNSPHL